MVQRTCLTSIIAHLREWANATADRPAVIGPAGSMTYGELNVRVRRIAAGLRKADLPPGSLAGIDAARSPDTLSLILGGLHAGLSVLPLESEPGPEAIGTALREAGAACFLSTGPLRDSGEWPVPVLTVGDLARSPAETAWEHDVKGSPALYTRTTGSTGDPVLFRLSQDAALFHAANFVQALDLVSNDRIALLIPPSAGAAVSIVFGSLLAGATLYLFDPTTEGLERLADGIRRERITAAYFTASLFRSFARAVGPDARFPDLRAVKLGGEPVESEDARKFRAMTKPGAVLVNGLGITDVGGNICFIQYDGRAPLPDDSLPVGFPVDGLEVRIVDNAGRDAEMGEIVVRGPYLAEPVGRNDEATGGDEVRTGDVGQWLPDGSIQHIGRSGELVKIRGRRVVPALTDRTLRGMPGVRDAATVVCGRGGMNRLVTFVEGPTSEARLSEAAGARLSPPQIPSRIVILERLPRLANGKIDRAALTELVPADSAPGADTATPSDPLERQLWDVWRSILRWGDFGCTETFWSLGGDSLQAGEMLARLGRITGRNLPLTTLHEAPTIRSLAARIREAPDAEAWNVVVEMTNPGSGRPFICVPGAGSDVETLRDLAEGLGQDRPFAALRMPGTDGASWPPDTMDDILDSFLPAVRRYQPLGPYLLGGSSFGGVVAYELACRLAADGEMVVAAVLLDTYAATYPRPRPGLSVRDRMRVYTRGILPITNKYEYSVANIRKGLRERRIRSASAILRRFRKHHKFASAESRCLCLLDAALRAHRRYRPGAYHGRVDLFCCEQPVPEDLYLPDPSLGWNTIAAGELALHAMGGRHGGHISPPHVDGLARQLQRLLRELEQHAPASEPP